MTDDLGSALIQKFGEDVVADVLKPSAFTAAPSRYKEVAGWLLTEGNFRFLSDLTVNHTPGRQVEFEVVCRLTDIDSPRRVTLRTPAPGDPPTVASLTALWPGADWFEREAFDMFGVIFDGHPNLTRILMPDEWEGHPLRKDYAVGKVPVEYKHLSPGF